MTEPVARAVKDFCLAYGISERSAYNLMEDGTLVFKKMGKRTLITEESAKAWFESLPTSSRTHVSAGTPVPTPAAAVHKGATPRKVVRIKELGL